MTKADRTRIRRQLHAVLLAGEMLSNVAFNAKQNRGLDERYRRPLGELQPKWDAAVRALPRWMKRP